MKVINEHEIPAKYILWSNLRQSSQIHATLEALVRCAALKTIYPEGFLGGLVMLDIRKELNLRRLARHKVAPVRGHCY